MTNFDFSPPKFMKKAQQFLQNYSRSCKSRLPLQLYPFKTLSRKKQYPIVFIF